MNPLGTPHQQGLLAFAMSCGSQQVSGGCTSVHPLLEPGDGGAEANSFHRAHQWTPCLQTMAQAALELHGWESLARTT